MENKPNDPDHVLYKDGDRNIPSAILDNSEGGQVALDMCKLCGKAEIELSEPCTPKLKTLGIENDWDIPTELRGFCDDYPELIGKLTVLPNARGRDPRDVAAMISKFDRFVVASTFMYKDQLEELMNHFATGTFGPGPFTFFIEGILLQLERWSEKDEFGDFSYEARMNFSDHGRFLGQLNGMLSSGKMILYDVRIERSYIDERTGGKPEEGEIYDIPLEYRQEIYAGARYSKVLVKPDGTYEHETDLYKIPDRVKLTNPGRRRPSSNYE